MLKNISAIIVLMFACTSLAFEEIKVVLTPAYNVFVRGEAVVVQLELINTGRDLIDVSAPQSGSLFIEVYYSDRLQQLKPMVDAPFTKPFQLNPGAKHISKIQLDKWFNLLKEGRYFAQLVLLHKGSRYESSRKLIDIVPGIPVLEGVQMFVGDQTLKRKFKVVRWNRSHMERVFLRIEDEPNEAVWDTIDLGEQLKGSDAKLDIAENGEVTVIHRTSQDAFHRAVIWSLPQSVEIAERNILLDPEVTASQRVRSLYGDMVEDGPVNPEDKKWWKFWK